MAYKLKSRPHSSKSLNAQSTHIQGKCNLVKLSLIRCWHSTKGK
jgi:hypothetical protein